MTKLESYLKLEEYKDQFRNDHSFEVFSNLFARHLTAYCHDSPYKSIGNIIHWIAVYSGLSVAEQVIIDTVLCKVTYKGEDYASFSFDEDLRMPIFEFHGERTHLKMFQDMTLHGLEIISRGNESE